MSSRSAMLRPSSAASASHRHPDAFANLSERAPGVRCVNRQTLGYRFLTQIAGAIVSACCLHSASAGQAAAAAVDPEAAWQQFIYATDYSVKGEGAVFIQYWLIDVGSARCPSGFASDGADDCFGNSSIVTAPDMPITALGELTLSGTAAAGGNVRSPSTTAARLFPLPPRTASSISPPSGRSRSSTSSAMPAARERTSTAAPRSP